MTHPLVIGAAGMVGRKLTERLVRDGSADRLTLVDVIIPDAPSEFTGEVHRAALDLSAPGAAAQAVSGRPDLIFHLAAIVSGEAEADLEKGYRINLDGTRLLLEAIRIHHEADGYRPRVVYSSSIAVFGGDLPDVVPEDFRLTPQTSYGVQKAMGELIFADYARRGILEGVGIRLPTIVVRPGKPNRAASGFFSGIIREPLVGQEAILPVDESVRHWIEPPLRRGLPPPRRRARHRPPRRPAQPLDARHRGDRWRADRGAPPRRRQRDGRPHPPRARRVDRPHGRRLGPRARPVPRDLAGFYR
jgi:nucleoside-diphosphate-sugar epimerase